MIPVRREKACPAKMLLRTPGLDVSRRAVKLYAP
jgi:hypothetical protein